MGMDNDQEVQGNWDQAKGKVKEGLGDLTDNEKMEYEGKFDQGKGKVEEGIGEVRDAWDNPASRTSPSQFRFSGGASHQIREPGRERGPVLVLLWRRVPTGASRRTS